MKKPLTRFGAASISGKSWWTAADLKGKTTLITVWATWCAPCRSELPEVQKLFDLGKERADIQVVSISVDANPGDVSAFLKETHYTFPVLLPEPSFVDSVDGEAGIPRNWIVDSKGILRLGRVGYDPADWPQQILQKLTSLKGQQDSPTSAR